LPSSSVRGIRSETARENPAPRMKTSRCGGRSANTDAVCLLAPRVASWGQPGLLPAARAPARSGAVRTRFATARRNSRTPCGSASSTRAPAVLSGLERTATDLVAVLRAAAGPSPYDRALTDLVGELGTRSQSSAPVGGARRAVPPHRPQVAAPPGLHWLRPVASPAGPWRSTSPAPPAPSSGSGTPRRPPAHCAGNSCTSLPGSPPQPGGSPSTCRPAGPGRPPGPNCSPASADPPPPHRPDHPGVRAPNGPDHSHRPTFTSGDQTRTGTNLNELPSNELPTQDRRWI